MNAPKNYCTVLLVLFALLSFKGVNAQQIADHFFGQNAWMPDSIGSKNFFGKLHNNWGAIGTSKAAIIRFGGVGADKNMPTNYQYVKMIDSIRANGMEPLLQVPYNSGAFTAQQAANIVQYLNIVKGKNVKYWSIGNEPDQGYAYTTAAQIAAYFRAFASAMKAVDPSILIVGPECSFYRGVIYAALTTPGGPDDITGKDSNGRYYLDVISFHHYGFNGTQTRAQLIPKLTQAGGLQDNLTTINSRIAACNAAHGRTGSSSIKVAITEANVNWQNSASDDLYGVGVNSFIGGQYVAEIFGVCMKKEVDFVNVWSVIEGNSTALNIGYLDRLTMAKKPMYYHFKMMAENFKGNLATTTSNQTNVKSFGAVSTEYINVLVMNQDQSNNFDYTVKLSNASISGTNALKINVDAGVDVAYSDVLANQSTVVLTFNLSGRLVKKTVYTLANHAAQSLPPTVYKAPSITLTSPAANASFDAPATIPITADVEDADSNLTKVEFFEGENKLGEDTTVPYSFDWTNVAAGTYSISAKATNNKGMISASEAVTVAVNALPTVAIISPANNSSAFAGSTLVITADAADTDGSVTKVEFFEGVNKLGEVNAAPYSFDWNNVAPGSYTLTAKATDNHGAVSTLAEVEITVVCPPANVSIPDVYAINPAVDAKNTIYIGYGPTSLSLNTVVEGPSQEYAYNWSTGDQTSSTSVSRAGSYTVTVRYANGCQLSASTLVKTLDVTCGNSNTKVMLCHNSHAVCVASSAVQEHLDHGDALGDCDNASSARLNGTSPETVSARVITYPNPVDDILKIKLDNIEAGATLQLYNISGAMLINQPLISSLSTISLKELPKGVYYVQVRNGNQVNTKKIAKP